MGKLFEAFAEGYKIGADAAEKEYGGRNED